jgi:hypothetical protein
LGLPVTAPAAFGSQSARQILVDQLRQWGLEELVDDLDRLIKQGLDAPAVTINLQATEAYQKRFAGNEQRRKKGLPVLNPAEYIAAENSYQSVLRGYGLPTSFYDSRDDFHEFIGNDVSPEELNDRAGIAQQIWLSKDAGTRDVWRSFYGLSDGAAIASILDPDRALPVVQRMANAARFGAQAKSQGLQADKDRLERYADMGLSEGAIAEGFGQIGATLAADQKIAQRFGTSITQAEREKESIEGSADAMRKRSSLYQNETALFQQKASAGEGALSRTRSGSF